MGVLKSGKEQAFKEGMKAGAQPCEEKFSKQVESIKEISENFKDSVQESILPTMNLILDTLDSEEKKNLLGICSENDIKTLEDDYKEILINILYQLLRDNPCPAEHQKNYIKTIQKYLDIPVLKVQDFYDTVHIKNIDLISVQKTIVKSVMEFLFLKDENYEFLDNYGDFFDLFALKPQDFAAIRSRIDKLYLIGAETIIAQYGYLTEELLQPDENSPENIPELQDHCDLTHYEMEDTLISAILHVPTEETMTFSYKNIQIRSFINCDGSMEFDSCVIYYNESTAANKITLGTGASISFKRCTFICKSYNESVFIEGTDNIHIVFENCIFENCSNFFHTDYHRLKEFVMKDCYIKNCFGGFVQLYAAASSDVTICECIIIEENISSFHQESIKKYRSYKLFDIQSTETSNCSITNNTLIGSPKFISFIASKEAGWTYFETLYTSISHCTFVNSSGDFISGLDLTGGSVQNCHFKECRNTIGAGAASLTHNGTIISHCLFEHCTNILNLGDHTTVSYCTFLNCYNSIICAGGVHGGNHIENCDFINLSYLYKKRADNAFYIPACITLHRANLNDSFPNTIKKCIFDSVNLKDAFLIRSNINEKITGDVISISECDFRNCSTDETHGKIIQTSEHYFALFNKKVDIKTVSISSCKGLDNISNSTSTKINSNYKFDNRHDMGSMFAQRFDSNPAEELIHIVENMLGDLSTPVVGFTPPATQTGFIA